LSLGADTKEKGSGAICEILYPAELEGFVPLRWLIWEESPVEAIQGQGEKGTWMLRPNQRP